MILLLSGCAATTAQDIQPTATPTALSTRDTTEPSITTTDISQPTPLPSASLPVSPTRQIVFQARLDSEENTNIYTIRADGTNLTQLTNSTSNDLGPVWSPDGQYIAFSSDRDGQNNIYRMLANGAGTQQLTTDGGEAPIWSPDGTRLAFIQHRNQESVLAVVQQDGTGLQPLWFTQDTIERHQWSPDGTQLAVGVLGTYTHVNRTVVLNQQGQEQYSIRDFRMPAWFPDGLTLVGVTPQGLVLAAQHGADMQVLNVAGTYPVVAPDGTRIAFLAPSTHHPETTWQKVYVMDRDGSHRVQVGVEGGTDHFPVWSPDSTAIAYLRTLTLDGTYLMVSRLPPAQSLVLGTATRTGPDWQPSVP
jgi:TolB protein